MLNKNRIILLSGLLFGVIFNSSVFADDAPVIKILIINPQKIPLTFSSSNKYGNSCVYSDVNTITCTVNNTSPPGAPFILSLQGNSLNNPEDCGVDVGLYGYASSNNFWFHFDSTYSNGSFTPLHWDGKSNVSATLTVGNTNGSCPT